MGLIGKNVKVDVRDDIYNDHDYEVGVILDKYLGFSKTYTCEIRADGRKEKLPKMLNVDFYIIKTEEKIIHVECYNVVDVIAY